MVPYKNQVLYILIYYLLFKILYFVIYILNNNKFIKCIDKFMIKWYHININRYKKAVLVDVKKSRCKLKNRFRLIQK